MTDAQARQRDTRLLTLAQGLALAVSGITITIGPLTLLETTGGGRWSGAVVGVLGLAAGAGAYALGRRMAAAHRRGLLAAAHALYGLAGIAAALAAAAGSTAGVLAAVTLIGAGQGAALLGRVIATQMHAPSERGRIGGRMLAVGVVGAVTGPPAVAALRGLAGEAGADPAVLPWLAVTVAGAAALGAVRATRLSSPAPPIPAPSGPGPAGGSAASVPIRMVTVALAATQATMAGAMAVAPMAVHHHTGSDGAMALVVSAHLAGMYAAAPAIGRMIDRRGARAGIGAGAAASLIGAVLIAAAHAPLLAAAGLVLVGVGWSAAYIGATAALTESGRPGRQARSVGAADLWGAASGAAAAGADAAAAGALGLGVVALMLAAPAVVALSAVAPRDRTLPVRLRRRAGPVADGSAGPARRRAVRTLSGPRASW
jgi:MFS family permease